MKAAEDPSPLFASTLPIRIHAFAVAATAPNVEIDPVAPVAACADTVPSIRLHDLRGSRGRNDCG